MIQSKQRQKKQREQMRYAFFALLIASIVLLGGGAILFTLLNTGAIATRASYSTTQLAKGSYSNTITCSGTIEPISVINVYSPDAEKIASVAVHEGDYVSKGDLLFTVQYATADALDQNGVSSSSVSTSSQTALQTEVRAETSGTIANVKISEGSSIDDLHKRPAMQIDDMNVLVGVIQLPEDVVPYVGSGVEVEAVAPYAFGYKLRGILLDIADSSSGAGGKSLYRDAVVMFGDMGNLQVGAIITAQIDIDDYGKVYYVPSAAVLEQDGCAYVEIVYTNNTVARHQVRLLGTSDDGQKIIAGDALAEGTTVRADLSN